MNQLNIGVTADVAKLIIADRLAVFQGQQIDEVLYREMEAHLNSTIHAAFATGFTVEFQPLGEQAGGVCVSFMTGGNRMTIGIGPSDMRECEAAIHAELDLLIEAAARMTKDAVDISRRYGNGRHVSIAHTHFQEGFSALRRSHSKEDPDAY